MADNLVFGVKIDLQKGVEEALKDGDKALERIEKLFGKHPITIKLRMDNRVARGTSAELTGFKKQLAELTQQWNSLTAAERGGAAGAAIREKFRALRTEAQGYTSTLQAAVKSEDKMRESHSKTAASANKLSSAYHNQSTYLSRLIQRMAAYAGVSYVGNFLTNVREVTAQFELQRISLGAIIQDQQRANQLFEEIKTFALKSPVKILDLTKYTKQLAAYKIGVDELFDTTKRLTDISVGLGVSMDRIVLMYGQIRATGYLRASEVRQATEAGIPLVEELANKLSKANGELVTAADVMDMISKQAISFDMVKEVFDDMTSAGGIFYNMQEKQGNTLYGLWAKLGDAASIMYDEIGNTDSVNSVMKDSIQFLTDLMKNWRLVGREMVVAAGTFLLLRAKTVLTAQGTALATKATNDYAAATTRLNAAQKRGAQTAAYAASLSKKVAVLNRAASISTNAWTAATLRLQAAMYSLKAAFIGNWVTLAIAAVAAIGAALYSAYEKAHKLQNELKEISDAGQAESAKSVFNFERLANAALEAATGSQEQKEALDELKRTYGDIIPVEQLSLENLQQLRAQGYEPLTAAIKEYIAQRTLQKEIDAITSHYTEDTIAKQRQLRELFKRGSTYSFFKGVAWSPIEGLDDDQISQVFANVDKIAKDKSKSWEDVWVEAIKSVTDVSEDAEKKMRKMFVNETQNAQQQSYNNKMRDIVENTRNMADETDTATKKMEVQTGSLGKYKQTLDETSKSLANLRLIWSNDKEVDPASFLGKQMVSNASIKAWKEDIIENLQDAGIAIRNEWFNIITNLNPKDPSKISSINFAPILNAVDAAKDKLGDGYVQLRNSIVKYQELYDGIVPSDRTVSAMRSRLMQIASNIDKTGGIMNDLQRHLMKSGDNWENYSKSVRDAVKDYETQIDEMKKINASIKNGEKGVGPLDPSKYSDEEIKKVQLLVEALKQLFPFLAPWKSSGSGTKSDPRLQNLKEEISLTKKLYDEYHKLEKQIGATKAAEKIKEIYSNTIKTLQDRATAYKFDFKLPFTDDNLKANMQHFIDKMKELQGLKDKKGKPLFSNIGKEIDEAVAQLEDVDLNSLQKALEKKLKELSDRISRTKTAKEFYEKILSTTGNVDMAINLTTSIFGENGEDLNKQIALQIYELINSGEGGIEVGLDVVGDNYNINYKNLRKLTEEAYKAKKIGDQAYKDLIAIADNGEKDVSKMVDGWLKATEKAKSYSDKLLDLARTTNAEIAKIEAQRTAGNITDDYAKVQIQGYKDKQAQEIAKLQYEAFKDSPMYVQMFDDLDNASTTMLRNMKQRIEELKTSWKDLTPTQLKEMQSRLNEIDAQLAKRNPFKGLIDGIKEYRNLRKGGDALGNKSEGAAEKALDAAAKARLEAEKEYLEILNKEGATQEEIAAAKKRFDDAAADEDAAAKAVENWKKVKDAIGLSANELFQMLNWAGDIAKGIADISEAMGADEEDVQYWNDVADALGQISGGIQDIVSAAMSGNVVGIISSTLTAIPKMFVGFTNLFSAGKIKRANKEIKRQQKLLDQLEYTYGRLEVAADKVFGREYVSNYSRQLEVLRAQQAAYLKQAEAERSKGKKKDKDKIKEYEEQARETADKIKEMQDELVAHIVGTDVASAARDFANAWLDAYLSFGSTTDAIKEKFRDMIKNMVVESYLAQTVKNALQPIFDMIDERLKDGELSEQDAADIIKEFGRTEDDIDDGLRVRMELLKKMGIDLDSMRDKDSEYSGIVKSVAGATPEGINNVAAIGNTLLYYASPIPRIDENLARVVALMEGRGASAIPQTTSAGWTDWQQQAMDNYIAIQRNTADTVVECRRAAEACERIASTFKVKGSTKGLNVFLNS